MQSQTTGTAATSATSAALSARARPYPIVDSGQTLCYNATAEIEPPAPGADFYGQDAQVTGNQPSYTRSADGLTVTDNVTGLIWQQSPDTNGDGVINVADKMTWEEAQAYPATLNARKFGGFDDWRLPTIKELYSLILFVGTDPNPMAPSSAGQVPFIDTDYFAFAYGDTAAGERIIDSQYASSTKYVSTTMNGDETLFGVNFADGRIKGYGLHMPDGSVKKFVVSCVRGNPGYGQNDFKDNGDGTITDKATGLMWAQADSGKGLDWQEALAWVQQMNAESYLGHNDWRLPGVKELQSIIEYARSPDTSQSAAVDPLFTCTGIVNEAGAARLSLLLDQHHPRGRRRSGGHGRLYGFRQGDGIHGAWDDARRTTAERLRPGRRVSQRTAGRHLGVRWHVDGRAWGRGAAFRPQSG